MDLATITPGVVLCLLAIEPHYMKYSMAFLSENLTAFLLVLLTGSFLYSMITHSRLATCCVMIFGGLAVMSHPVVIFFVFFILVVTLVKACQFDGIYFSIVSFVIFVVILLSWPLRNELVFNHGMFMTSSQGAVFSKSWNDKVLIKHTNTQGDLLDEGLNVTRYSDLLAKLGSNPIQNSSIMQEATLRYLGENDVFFLFKMALWKWYCGINPIPQTEKSGSLEAIGTIFRVLYLIGLLLGIFALLTHQFTANSIYYWSTWILIMLFAAISITSIGLYTGLRFNSVYAPVNVIFTTFLIFGLCKSNLNKGLKNASVAKHAG